MKLNIENLYGINNQVEFNGDNLIIFGPNGSGKTSISKGFDNVIEGEWNNNIDDEGYDKTNFTLDGKEIFNEGLGNDLFLLINKSVIDSEDVNSFLLETIVSEISSYNEGDNSLEDEVEEMIKEINFKEVQSFDEDNTAKLIRMNKEAEDFTFSEDEYNNVLDQYKELENIYNSLLSSKTTKIKKFKNDIEKRINDNTSKGKEFDNSLLIDSQLINDIFSKNRENMFMYKFNGNFINMIEAKKYMQIEMLKMKISEKDSNLYTRLKEMEKYNFKITASTSTSSIQKSITNELDDLSSSIIMHKVAFKRSEIEKLIKKIIDADKINIKLANNFIDELNQHLHSDNLKWKAKIEKIISLQSQPEIKIYRDGNDGENEYHLFEDYASDGEKTILKFIIFMIATKGNNRTYILDDIVTSMDTHHTSDFSKTITNLMEKYDDMKFIILTHDFTFFRTLSYTLWKKFSFYILDRDNIDNSVVYTVKSRDLQNIFKTMLRIHGEDDEHYIIRKIILLANSIREFIDGYILKDIIPINCLNNESITGINPAYTQLKSAYDGKYEKWVNVIEWLDSSIRHYKNKDINDILLDMPDSLEDLKVQSIDELIRLLNSLKERGVHLHDFIKDIELDFSSRNFAEYISSKVLIGTSARFKAEYFTYYYSENKKLIENWESKEWCVVKPKNQHKSIDSNYLVHVNNINWNMIIEMPNPKIVKLWNKHDESIKHKSSN